MRMLFHRPTDIELVYFLCCKFLNYETEEINTSSTVPLEQKNVQNQKASWRSGMDFSVLESILQ